MTRTRKVTKKTSRMDEPVFVTCYNKRERWNTRREAMAFYLEGARCCDGCEAERYFNVFTKLLDGYNDVDDR